MKPSLPLPAIVVINQKQQPKYTHLSQLLLCLTMQSLILFRNLHTAARRHTSTHYTAQMLWEKFRMMNGSQARLQSGIAVGLEARSEYERKNELQWYTWPPIAITICHTRMKETEKGKVDRLCNQLVTGSVSNTSEHSFTANSNLSLTCGSRINYFVMMYFVRVRIWPNPSRLENGTVLNEGVDRQLDSSIRRLDSTDQLIVRSNKCRRSRQRFRSRLGRLPKNFQRSDRR